MVRTDVRCPPSADHSDREAISQLLFVIYYLLFYCYLPVRAAHTTTVIYYLLSVILLNDCHLFDLLLRDLGNPHGIRLLVAQINRDPPDVFPRFRDLDLFK